MPEPPLAREQITEDDDCAIVVAMGNYEELTQLRGPAPDAVKFCTWLREKGGLKDTNIKLIVNDELGRPKNEDIPKALNELGVRMQKRKGRRLYFYYAGHGLAPEFNDIAMVPANAMQGALEHTCFSVTKCMNFFINTGFFDELIIFMDCCREREEVPTIPLPYKFDKPFLNAKKVNHFVLMAAGDGAKSFEVRALDPAEEGKFRGLMTTALIEGLNGAPGAIDANGNVTATSLSRYVATRVKEEAREKGLPQQIDNPKPPDREIVFYTVAKDQIPTIALRLVIGPQSAGKPIMLLNEDTKAMETQGPGEQGDVLTFTLEGHAHYHLIVPGHQPVPVNPAAMPSDQPDVPLP